MHTMCIEMPCKQTHGLDVSQLCTITAGRTSGLQECWMAYEWTNWRDLADNGLMILQAAAALIYTAVYWFSHGPYSSAVPGHVVTVQSVCHAVLPIPQQ